MLTEKEQARLDDLLAKEKEVGRGKDPKLTAQIKALLRKKKLGGKDDSKDKKFVPGNDFSWWNKEANLLKDAANLRPNYIPGMPLDPLSMNFTLPGVIKFLFYSVYGTSRNTTDPINVWARDLYLRMFQKWRGISAYEYPDLGITTIAGIEVVGMISKLERIYGVVNRYSKLNLNIPRTEVAALGLTPAQADYIRGHLSDFRYDLNYLLKKAQRLCIPFDMSVLADRVSLLGYEYLDHDNIRGQIVIFDCEYFGIFSDTLMQSGSAIKYSRPGQNGAPDLIDFSGSSDNMFPFLEAMLDALLGSTGVQKIYGDLVTWFGEDQMVKFLPLAEDYIIAPVYSESILHKCHNALTVGGNPITHVIDNRLGSTDNTTLQTLGRDNRVIYQVDNCIVTEFCICNGGPNISSWQLAGGVAIPVSVADVAGNVHKDSILDTYRNDMTEETVTEGELFKYVANPSTFVVGGTPYYGCPVVTAAFEIIAGITYYTYDFSTDTVLSAGAHTIGAATNVYSWAAKLAIMDWAPVIYMRDTNNVVIDILGDVDLCVPVPTTQITRLHRAAVLSGIRTEIAVRDSTSNARA